MTEPTPDPAVIVVRVRVLEADPDSNTVIVAPIDGGDSAIVVRFADIVSTEPREEPTQK